EHGVGGRKEVVSEQLTELFLAGAEEGSGRITKRQRTVRNHRHLHLAVIEPVKGGRLRLAEWGLRLRCRRTTRDSGVRSCCSSTRADKQTTARNQMVKHAFPPLRFSRLG